jgi:hypothetical protein
MRRFWKLWSGHVLLGLGLLTFAMTLWFGARSMGGYEVEIVWWNFVIATLFGLLSACILMLATYRWNTFNQRRLIRFTETPPPVGQYRQSPV